MSQGFPEANGDACGDACGPASLGSSTPRIQSSAHSATPSPSGFPGRPRHPFSHPRPAATPNLSQEQSSSPGLLVASHQEITQAGFCSGLWGGWYSVGCGYLEAAGGGFVASIPASPQEGPYCTAGELGPLASPSPVSLGAGYTGRQERDSAPTWGFGGPLNQRTPQSHSSFRVP